jgi:hypothetical protein
MRRAIVRTSILIGALAGACAGPQTPAVVSPTPCHVDEHGTVVADGGQEAMCCPKDYIAGGNSEMNCPKDQCCPLTSEVNGVAPHPQNSPLPQPGPPQPQ